MTLEGVLLVDWQGGESEERKGIRLGRVKGQERKYIQIQKRMSGTALNPDPSTDSWD